MTCGCAIRPSVRCHRFNVLYSSIFLTSFLKTVTVLSLSFQNYPFSSVCFVLSLINAFIFYDTRYHLSGMESGVMENMLFSYFLQRWMRRRAQEWNLVDSLSFVQCEFPLRTVINTTTHIIAERFRLHFYLVSLGYVHCRTYKTIQRNYACFPQFL